MSNRARLILSLFLALAGKALAQDTAIQVQVYDYAGLTPAVLREFVTLTESILTNAGLSIHVKPCERNVEASCEIQTRGARRLVIRVVAKTMRNVRGPLGLSFADHEGGTYASVFLAPVRHEAAEQDFPWVTILAYAAAHEIGHLLLGNQAHTPWGLMKAKWDREDYKGMNQHRCIFNSEQILQLTQRYGASLLADPSKDTALTNLR